MTLLKLTGCLLLGLACATAYAADAASPARLQLEGFIAAFNSGDRATIEAFGREHAPPGFLEPRILDDTLRIFEQTGGLDLLTVEESGPLALDSRVRERRTHAIQHLRIVVDPASPQLMTVVQLTSDDAG